MTNPDNKPTFHTHPWKVEVRLSKLHPWHTHGVAMDLDAACLEAAKARVGANIPRHRPMLARVRPNC